jgi:hypothetical protein
VVFPETLEIPEVGSFTLVLTLLGDQERLSLPAVACATPAASSWPPSPLGAWMARRCEVGPVGTGRYDLWVAVHELPPGTKATPGSVPRTDPRATFRSAVEIVDGRTTVVELGAR